MMKAKLYIVALTSIALFYSCNDFLDVVPDNRTVLDSPEAVQQLLVDAYPGAHYYHICEIMSDNAGERNVTGTPTREILNREMYYWEEGFLSGTSQDTPSYLWTGYYNAIASANQALQSISEAPDQSKYQAQKGEALICRAFAHFILVNIFAEHYDPATAGTMLGIPYNTEPENVAIKNYKRNSIAEVYDLIEKDLQEGLPLIADNVYEVPKYHFTKAAANAFASRFYLYKGDWDKTIQHADIALGDNIDAKILPLNAPVFTDVDATTYRAQYRRVDQPNILLLSGAASWWARDAGSSSLRYGMLTRHWFNVMTTRNIEGGSIYYKGWQTSAADAIYLYKYPEYFKYSYQGATTGIGYVMGALLTIEEALMNRAEAYAMKGGAGNFDKAIADMTMFLKKRLN
ncbi:MAG: RagB/SusD family nutrient uptake outer membrane protein, partial [Dysgonamonadaceae bacterium]|nr:RagB/SusD family nutrient uptake outer membrane protein [Dysgonamonadaceae bacterium]